MAVALVQQAVNSSGGLSVTTTLSATPTDGNLLVAFLLGELAVTDALTGWTPVPDLTGIVISGQDNLHAWYKVASGDTAATTYTSVSSHNKTLHVSEWSGVRALIDSATKASTVLAASLTVGPATLAGSVGLAIGAILASGTGAAGGNTTVNMVADAPYTQMVYRDVEGHSDPDVSINNSPAFIVAYDILAATGDTTLTATAVTGGFATGPYGGILLVFEEYVAPPTPGIWIAFANQALPFSTGAVAASDDQRLARALPQAAPTGVTDDVTSRVLRAEWNRGGAYDHVGSSGPGGFSLTLNNFDGRYDPDNTASPLYGKLNPGIPVWGGAIKATGALGTAAGTGAVAGFMAGIVREFVPTVRNGERICEVIGDDAFEVYRRSTVSVAPSLSRSHATFRGLILDGVGESSTRRDLATESGMLPFSAVDSANALDVLEDLNRATATRHYIRPADTKEDWYAYVTVNKLHKLQSAADQTLDGDDIDDVSGWRVTNANTIQVQRATVEPISVTPNNAEVWVFEDTPFTVTSAARKVIWANFDDYVFDASVDTNIASGSITTTITNFGKSAKIEIWTASTAVVGLLRVLGRQVVRGDSITVVAGDEAVGALSGNTIASDYIGQEGAAQGLVDFIVWKYGQPLKRPSITVVSKNAATRSTIFERDLFDVLTLSVDKLSVTSRRAEIVGLRGSVVPGKFYSLTYELQETPNQSALDWFDVNTDSVNGSVLIAPF